MVVATEPIASRPTIGRPVKKVCGNPEPSSRFLDDRPARMAAMAARARILVVEDEPRLAELLRLYLERDGHRVTVVGDGRAAIEAVDARPGRPGRPRPHAPGRQRRGRAGRDPRTRRHAGPHRLGQAQRPRAHRRAADGGRRLPRQAVQPARADRPGRGRPPPQRRAGARRPRWAIDRRRPRASCRSTPAGSSSTRQPAVHASPGAGRGRRIGRPRPPDARASWACSPRSPGGRVRS